MKRFAIPAVAVVVASFAGSVSAEEGRQCDRSDVRTILSSGSYEVLCDCATITDKSIRKIQRSFKFEKVLRVSVEQCSGLADLLFDDNVISTRSGTPSNQVGDPDDPNFPPHDGPDPEPESPEPEAPEPEAPEPETPEPEQEEPEDEGVYNGW